MSGPFVNIAFPSSLRQLFTYRLKQDRTFPVYPGQRVVAPLKNVQTIGFIVETDVQAPKSIKIKDLIEIIDPEPLIPVDLFKFLIKLANYYLAPIGKVLSAAIPSEYQIQKKRRLVVIDSHTDTVPDEFLQLFQKISSNESILLSSLAAHYDRDFLIKGIGVLKQLGKISESPVFSHPRSRRWIEKTVKLAPHVSKENPDISKRASRQWEIIETLLSNNIIRHDDINRYSSNAMKTLLDKKLIIIEENAKTDDAFWQDFHPKDKKIDLTNEQLQVFSQIQPHIKSDKFSPFLLQGVTGCGKTEVYLKLINEAISIGKSALVLVPEITLTIHLASRFRGEFQDKIAVWHSQLSGSQRSIVWKKIRDGDYPVVIGARSAVLLPLKNLGLIIVDEEHDGSYKQREQEPKYHARDAALMRAVECHSTVVMGSATPSLESLYNAATGKFQKVELTLRHSSAPSVKIEIIDMKKEWKETGDYNAPISRALFKKISEKLKRSEQVLLLQNRRGYSNVVLCPDCGWVPRCRNCDITLTYHKINSSMQCHYCNLIEVPPTICPKCQANKFLYPGYGTQRIETKLQEVFPDHSIMRLDIDTTRKRGFAQQVMKKFERGEIHIIIGTQMIAKGLDFPNVTLVGVLNADIGLFMPDFRARERVFQLLYQVAGRAGRGKIQGEVLIQTFNPQDITVRYAMQQNIAKFTAMELNERNPINYPPFSRVALILISDLNDERALETAENVTRHLKQLRRKMEILGPTPAPLRKIKNRYRYITIIKSRKETDPNGSNLRRILYKFITSPAYHSFSRRARISVEIDPLDLL
jgi:primosomal protein N' (replication factor Y)